LKKLALLLQSFTKKDNQQKEKKMTRLVSLIVLVAAALVASPANAFVARKCQYRRRLLSSWWTLYLDQSI
jgi:hypothetical protein